MEQRSGNTDVSDESQFDYMRMQMANDGEVLQTGTRFEGEENREAIERDGGAVHLRAEVQSLVREGGILDG